MITHYFSFPASHHADIEAGYDAIFSTSKTQTKVHLPEEELFDITSEFQNPLQIKSKITLTTSGTGVLRIISHALSLQHLRFAVSFVGEATIWDPQFTYFAESSKENTLILNLLGQQVHLMDSKSPQPLDLRLGALRQNPGQARIYIADSTFVFFNINAMKWADAPAQAGNNPSGLTSEEANQLAYSAGQSHKNKYFILYGFDKLDRDPYGISHNAALQMLWYYQYGASQKKQDWPIPEGHQQNFSIESNIASYNLEFRKDRLTNNWFHRIPFDLAPDHEEHQWIATSYEEYQAMAQDDLPHRLLAWYDALEHYR